MKHKKIDKKVIIIHSGCEIDLSNADTIIQVNEVRDILQKSGIEIQIEDIKNPEILKKISNYDKDKTIIFNFVETFAGSDSKMYQFTAFLDFLNIPYTGASTELLLLTSNKILSKKILQESQIKTPKWLEAKDVTNNKMLEKYIVKSNTEHCSFGIDENSISDVNLAKIINEKQRQYGGVWFAEEYIDGREFNISVIKIGDQIKVLPIPEMVFNSDYRKKYKIIDYDMKWDEKSPFYDTVFRSFDHKSNPELINNLTQTTIEACQAFNVNSYIRIDYRVDKNDQIFVIDINANPCISSDAGFMAAAEKFGMSVSEVLINILKNTESAYE